MANRIILIMILVLIAVLTGLLLFHRVGNPGDIDCRSEGHIRINGIIVSTPIRVDSVKTDYWYDGGSITVEFCDQNGSIHVMCMDHRMGMEKNWGDVYYGQRRPGSGLLTGRGDEWNRLFYSICLMDDNKGIDGFRTVDKQWPRVYDVFLGYIERICR